MDKRTLFQIVRLATITTALALTIAATLLVGCATSRSGVTNTLGTLRTIQPARLTEAVEAARHAVDDLGLLLGHTSHDYEAHSAQLHVRARTGQKVTIAIAAVDDTHVRIDVRYGLTGDPELSQTILEHIQHQLTPRPEGVPPVNSRPSDAAGP